MNPKDVHRVLASIGANYLYHANSVSTSCTFLDNGALLSRGFVEDNGLVQTPQASDAGDKEYGIWHYVFLDHVDIHYRGGRTRGPNVYGPVLVKLDYNILLRLPAESEVFVTQCNPVYWSSLTEQERWFEDAEELSKNISQGDFNKMLVIKTPLAKLDLAGLDVEIFIDDPQRNLSNGTVAYNHAYQRVNAAASAGGLNYSINPHACRGNCSCIAKYADLEDPNFDSRFE